MRLAESGTTIRIGAETITLRPTLRAAFRLQRRYGFPRLIEAIREENLTIMADIILESSDDFSTIADALDWIASAPLAIALGHLSRSLPSHVLAMAGIDGDDGDAKPTIGKRVSFDDYHAQLYRLATGWLGWLPTAAWEATAAEITEAFSGRAEMLRAIYGGTEPEADSLNGPVEHTPEEVREGIETLRMLQGQWNA